MAPRYGALGATFQLARLFQCCSLIAITGMTAKFISSIVNNNATPPNILIGTISVVSLQPTQHTPKPPSRPKQLITPTRPASQ